MNVFCKPRYLPHNLNVRCAWLQGMPGKDGRDGAPGLDGEKVCKVLLKHCRKDFCERPMCVAELLVLVKKERGWKAFASKEFSNSVTSEEERSCFY